MNLARKYFQAPGPPRGTKYMPLNRKLPKAIFIVVSISTLLYPCLLIHAQYRSGSRIDVLVVGSGISGLSAALEAARGGAKVTVVDMYSVFGGHAVMSEGGVLIVGSPEQLAHDIRDSTELAYKDFMDVGEDADAGWVRDYVQHSRVDVHDWLTALGVKFEEIVNIPGNSVPRFHRPQGRGLGLVNPIYRACVLHPNIEFIWNTKVIRLMTERGRVVGVKWKNIRTGMLRGMRARAVILATGGFQSNLALVREYWPRNLPFPERILVGSGVNSIGSGLAIGRTAGAALTRMDHQWNYPYGLPDPAYPGGSRGLNAFNTASLWVNSQARRFVNELAGPKEILPVLLNQKPASYWMIFDEATKRSLWVAGSSWGDFRRIEELILSNPGLTEVSSTIEELAAAAGLPAAALQETVRRYNEMVLRGDDTEFGRFGPGRPSAGGSAPQQLEKAPFYAIRCFPMTRKSMGGVMIDRSCRVLNREGRPIRGLYAVGELTGLGGINGKAALEGTFLGPSILMGRVAAQEVLAELSVRPDKEAPAARKFEVRPAAAARYESASCLKCHNLQALIAKPRSGFLHFGKVHRVVLERTYNCNRCHSELFPFRAKSHRTNPLAQAESCMLCHVAQ